MTTSEVTWTPEMLARRRKIGIAVIAFGLSILGLVVYKIAACQHRNQMLFQAALNNDRKLVQELLESGANCHATDQYGIKRLVRIAGSADAVKLLLENCPDISAEEETAVLFHAAWMGDVGIVEVLLDKGVSVNSAADQSGWNALMVAAEKGHFGVASLLVERGADINARNREGKTALMLACERNLFSLAPGYGHSAIIQLLLEKGADVSQCKER